MTDAFVVRNGLSLATRDHGGSGPAVVLVPGAGRTLEDFTPLAAHLVDSHRVISMDLRGHGLSDDGPWQMDEVLEDVLAVAAHYELDRPAVVGHSLGGMIAALLATRPGVLSAAVNMDGHGSGSPEQYEGMPLEEVIELRDRLKQLSTPGDRPPVTAEVRAAMRVGLVAQAESRGLAPELVDAVLERTFRALSDGTFEQRPTPPSQREMLAALDALTLLKTYAETTCPLLVYNCTNATMPPGVPDFVAPLLAAYRRGLRRDLGELAASHPLVCTIELDTTHDLHHEQPELVAQQVKAFLASPQRPAP